VTIEQKLAGMKALVTGAGTGIGREIALEFARQGADVVLHYAASAAGAESASKEIHAMGRKAAAFEADFDNIDDVVRLGNKALEFLGSITCLVNNAGITFNSPFFKVTLQQYDKLYHVNMRAQFFLTQQLARHMVEQGGGSVCNVTSIHGVQGAPEHSVYAGTKGAIIAYTRSLAVELAHKGVRVNAIAPGWVTVESYYTAIPGFNSEDAQEVAKIKIPAGFSGVPLDIAKLAAFLCSDDSRYIVGQTIIADGGTTSLMSLIDNFRAESSAHFGRGRLPGV
jgi:NAD(P)-dependent dehydrogenase (short-subunit alcohol dehydrogenase family)